MSNQAQRILNDRCIEGEIAIESGARTRAARSVTFNAAESPLGWLVSRGLSRGGNSRPASGSAAIGSGPILRPGSPCPGMLLRSRAGDRDRRPRQTSTARKIDARRRFHAAVDSAGPGLADILWRVVCHGDGMREAETALGWPARAGKLVLSFALDRIAAFYRIP